MGVGGLINAYRTAAKGALENATIIEDEDRVEIEVGFTFEAMPFVMNVVKASDCIILSQEFTESPKIRLSFPISNQSLEQKLKVIEGIELK